MVTPAQIERAIRNVDDQPSFLQALLADALGWPIGDAVEGLDQISFGWSADELKADGLNQHLVDGEVWQIQPLQADQPWGIFLLEFSHPDAFVKGRGMAGPLRKALRGLVPKRRRDPHLAAWRRENLLFICTHDYKLFRFAYFKEPAAGTRAAPLATFGWGPDVPARTACEFNLPRLTWPETPKDAASWLDQWRGAFDKERLTREFFAVFADLYDKVREDIATTRDLKSVAGRLAQLLLDRMLFLYFIQRKGWLDEKHDYLYSRFLDCWKRDPGGCTYYSEVLYPLFLRLSGVGAEAEAVVAVPFLNGGLFEESDRQTQAERIAQARLQVRNETFKLVFERLLERFNFTVTEDTPLDVEVAIDPEMLGKIFESLVLQLEKDPGKDLRKLTGSYYTPRPIVHFMCREALKEYLVSQAAHAGPNETGAIRERVDQLLSLPVADQLDGEQARFLKALFTDAEARGLRQAVLDCRICDPAVGSGAFPVGMLHEMTAAIARLDLLLHGRDYLARRNYDYDLKKQIIGSCLYGVDIQEQAVRLCELRLWLSLVVDYQIEAGKPFAQAIREVPCLPNLSYRIVRGDSLLERLFGHVVRLDQMAKDAKTKQLIDSIQADKRAYFLEGKAAEKRHLELKILAKQADLAERLIEAKRAAVTYQTSMFGDEGLTAKERKARAGFEARAAELSDLRERVAQAKDALERLSRAQKALDRGDTDSLRRKFFHTGQAPTFMWRVDFAEVFGEKGGFDILIANPPYGFRNVLTQDQKKVFRSELGYAFRSGDVAELFIEQVPGLAGRAGSIQMFIVPKKSLYGESWHAVRDYWLDRQIICLMDASKAFADVLLEQVVFGLHHIPAANEPGIRVGYLDQRADQVLTLGAFRRDQVFDAVTRNAQIYRGMVGKALLDKIWSGSFNPAETPLEARIGLQNITPFLTDSPSGAWPCIKGIDIRRFGLKRLRYVKKSGTGDVPSHTIERHRTKKVVAQEIVAHVQNPNPHVIIMAYHDEDAMLAHETAVIVSCSDPKVPRDYLCAWLNSTVTSWYAHNIVYNRAIRTMHFIDYYVKQLPFPKDVGQEKVDAIAKLAREAAQGKDRQKEIDAAFYEIYGLDADDIAVIEGRRS
jgi:hypothetical protein